MPYYIFAADSFHIKKLCADFFEAKCDFSGKTAVLRFWAPLGDLGATYDDHLRLIWKARSGLPNFLFSVNWSFFSCVTAEALQAIICSKSAISLQRGSVDPKFQVEAVAPTKHSFSQKTRINDLSYGIKIWPDFSFILSQCTHLTDRILIARPRLHSTQRGKNGAVDICCQSDLQCSLLDWYSSCWYRSSCPVSRA